jgi:hypothetical protein
VCAFLQCVQGKELWASTHFTTAVIGLVLLGLQGMLSAFFEVRGWAGLHLIRRGRQGARSAVPCCAVLCCVQHGLGPAGVCEALQVPQLPPTLLPATLSGVPGLLGRVNGWLVPGNTRVAAFTSILPIQ